MIIYLVNFTVWWEECSTSTPMKAFVDKTIAELYILELEEKSKEFREKWKAINNEFEEQTKDLYVKLRNNVSYKKTGKKRKEYNEILEKITNFSQIRHQKSNSLENEYMPNEEDCLIIDPEREGFYIEEIELDDRKE